MLTRAHIGTSGFGVGRARYVQTFDCVEVQHTFYQPPKIATFEYDDAELRELVGMLSGVGKI